MAKLRVVLLSVFLIATASVAHGEVRVVVLSFGPSTPNYVVPAGKVLLIEHISAYYGNSTGGTFDKVIITIAASAENLTGTTTTVPWSFSTSNPNQSIHLERPLRAAAGSSVNILDTATGAAKFVDLQGLLLDQVDLYAANLGIELQGVSVADQRLTAEVKLATSRPAVVISTVSNDLRTWITNLTQIVSPKEAATFDVSTSIGPRETRKFMRVAAKAPEHP
jgi:hypothetical protein